MFCVHNQPTLCQWHVYPAIQCVMCSQWALGQPYFNNIMYIEPFWAFFILREPWEPLYEPHQDQSISRRFMSPRSPGSHFMSKSCTSSRSMHYVSPLSPRSHQASTPFTFSYFRRSGSLWAIDATIWTTSISIHFQILFVPNEPWEPLFISVMYF